MPFDPGSLKLTTTDNIQVSQTGITRVTYEALQTAGLDLAGVPVSKITVLNQNQMIPAFVYTTDPAGAFGPGGYIEFYGQALDTLYTGTNIYTVQVSSGAVNQLPKIDATPGTNPTIPGSYSYTLAVNNRKGYVNTTPGDEPWYDTAMWTYTTPASWSFPFTVNGLADPSAPSSLDLTLWGGSAFYKNPDHHLRVTVNGISVADQTFDGLSVEDLKVSLPAGTLHEGGNTMKLTLPGDLGVDYDVIYLEKYSFTYQRVFQPLNGQLSFNAAGDAFNVTNLPTGNVVVYRMNADGMARLDNVQVQGSGSNYTASFAGTSNVATYVVTTVEAMNPPVLAAARQPAANLNQPAQYLIISHPDFISGLSPLVQFHQAQGLTVNVVDVNDLYAKYTYGVFDPSAIKQYIAYAAKNLGTKYVLLVGGDTFDYRNYTGLNSISFIPSLYASTGSDAKFVPVDPLYADVNGDNVPDVAIGRLPVTTTAELTTVINKTLAYASKSYSNTAVFASDQNDGVVSFKDLSNSLASELPSNWAVQNIAMDDLSLADARMQLLAAMNGGTALVTFTGHSGPDSWAMNDLFDTNDAANLTNAGKPFVVVQWGCWNNYYNDPEYTYLAQSFLLSGDRGAAAVLGATTLVNSSSEQLLGELLTPRMTAAGTTIGQAVQAAKSALAKTHPGLLDVQLGWSLMGDPALVIAP